MDIPIIYEDNHLLVVEKPPNLIVQEDRSGDLDLLTLLKQDLKVRYQKPGNVFLGLVHRLDRPVGGVMVFAKTSKAASRISNAIRLKDFHRTYLAVIRGKPQEKSARLEHYLIKDKQRNIVHATSPQIKQAKKAVLDFEILEHRDELSLISVTLHTGRSHQIRVQLATHGFPLYGDQKYGSHVNRPGQQIALWAHTLAFPHPTTKELMSFRSLPDLNIYPWDQWETLKTDGVDHQ